MEPEELSKENRERSDRLEVPPELVKEIVALSESYGSRKIARRVGRSRKVVRRVLLEAKGSPPKRPKSLLAPFRDAIRERVEQDLAASRILREIQALGYQGGRTILVDLVRELRTEIAPERAKTKVKRRFETAPGEEMQVDWSVHRVLVGGVLVAVHVLGVLLAWSRKLFLGFYRDEKQSTLLAGLVEATEYLAGVAHRIVVDNMASAVLGRAGIGRKPIWHPRFTQFVKHYGCDAFACAVRDPDRKGKKERSFRYAQEDFLKGSNFDSWEDLQTRGKEWLDGTPDVGNNRVHGTTGRVPNQAWVEEKPFLIPLPQSAYPAHDLETRVVDQDSTLSVRGTRYSIPSRLAPGVVSVRLYPHHFDVVDRSGAVAFTCRYAENGPGKRKLVVDPTHYASRRPRTEGKGSGQRLEDAFLARFPELAELVGGLKLRMKALTGIHLRELVRLAERFGDSALLEAAKRAQQYGRHDSGAVRRILERLYPIAPGELEVEPLGSGAGPVLLGEVAPATLDGFAALDQVSGDAALPGESDRRAGESGDGA